MLDALQADLDLHDQPPPTLEDSHTGRRRPTSTPIIYIFLQAESVPLSP